MIYRLFIGLLVCALNAVEVRAETPATLAYQGQLGDAGGIPLVGTFTMRFALYDVASGGVALWIENQSIGVDNGNFSVQLGDNTPLPDSLFSRKLYLGIKVESDPEMTPRPTLNAAPFAFRARSLMSNTTVVSADDDALTNGTRLLTAVNSIQDASATNPYLLQLDAGIFDVGTSRIAMPDFVSITGAGREVTQIRSISSSAALDMGNNSTARQLTVINEGSGGVQAGGEFNCAICARSVSDVRIENAMGISRKPGDAIDTRAGVLIYKSSNVELSHVKGVAEGGDRAYGIMAWGLNQDETAKLNGLVLQDVEAEALRPGRFAAALELRGYNDAKIHGFNGLVDASTGSSHFGALMQAGASFSTRDMVLLVDGKGRSYEGSTDGLAMTSVDQVSIDGLDVTLVNYCNTSSFGHTGVFMVPASADSPIARISNMRVEVLPMDNCPGLVIGMSVWQAAPVISNSWISVSGTNIGSALGYLNLLQDDGTGTNTPLPAQGLTEISGSRIDVRNRNSTSGMASIALISRMSMVVRQTTIFSTDIAVQLENSSPVGPDSPFFQVIFTHGSILANNIGVLARQNTRFKSSFTRVSGPMQAFDSATLICGGMIDSGSETFLASTCPN